MEAEQRRRAEGRTDQDRTYDDRDHGGEYDGRGGAGHGGEADAEGSDDEYGVGEGDHMGEHHGVVGGGVEVGAADELHKRASNLLVELEEEAGAMEASAMEDGAERGHVEGVDGGVDGGVERRMWASEGRLADEKLISLEDDEQDVML